MESLPWFRFYHDFMIDPDVEELAFEDQRNFVFVLCMKAAGLLDKDFETAEKRDRAIGRRLGLQGEALNFAHERLVDSGLIDEDWQPRSWEKLQARSDHSKDRVRRHRERKKAVTECKHEEKTDVTGCNGYGNAVDKIREEKRDKKKPAGLEKPEFVSASAWADLIAHRKNLKVPLTATAWKGIEREIAKTRLSHDDAIAEMLSRGWRGFKASWVDQRADDPLATKNRA